MLEAGRRWDFRLKVMERGEDVWALRDLHSMLVEALQDVGEDSSVEVLVRREPHPTPKPAVEASARFMPEAVITVMTSGGGIVAMRSVLVQWLKQRKGPLAITIEYPDGRKVSINGDQMTDAAREEAVRTALRLVEESDPPAIAGSDEPPAQAGS